MKVFGVEFAPLFVSTKRRLQTLAAATWICSFLLLPTGGACCLVYLVLAGQGVWRWLAIGYFLWLWLDRDVCERGGRRCQWVREWRIWKYFRDYFPINIVKTCELDPQKNYILGSHPHGVLCVGAFCNFATEGNNFSQIFPGMTSHMLTLKINYMEPFYRDFFLTSGGVAATRRSIHYLLNCGLRGKLLVLVVGGAAEVLNSRPGVARLFIEKRKGFIKIALQEGVSLVPSFSFGETDVYEQAANPQGGRMRAVQEWILARVGIAPAKFIGRGLFQYSFGILPRRRAITTVVGQPIDVVKVADPCQSQIDELHTRYKNALRHLYESHRHKYVSAANVDLEFV